MRSEDQNGNDVKLFMEREEDSFFSKCIGRSLYHRWRQMLARCENPRRKDYCYYGARGVRVCLDWHDFRAFRRWFYYETVKTRGYPVAALSVDRVDPNMGYSPCNCRLITTRENSLRAIKCRDGRGRFAKAKGEK